MWLFGKPLPEQGLSESLFEEFDGYLIEQGYTAPGGQIVDATLIPGPKQHNSEDENKQIKQGELPQAWPEKPHKHSQKDTDARWTPKGGKSYFGSKNHICIDAKHGLIRRYAVTDASVHDSQVLGQLLDEDNDSAPLWADSAYRSEAIEETLNLVGFESQIHERGYRNHPLSEDQKQSNRTKSKTPALIGACLWLLGDADGWQTRAFYCHRASEGTIGTAEFDVQLNSLHVSGNKSS